MLRMLAIFVCLLGALFYFYEFFVRLMPAAMSHELMFSFHFGAAGLGVLASMFFYGYAPMQIPAGILLDKFGPRRILVLSASLCSVAMLLFSLTHNVYVAGTMRFLSGVTASAGFVSALLLGARWLDKKYYTMYVGLVQLLGCLGAIIGLAMVAALNQHFPWRHTLFGTGIIGLVIAVFIVIFVKDSPRKAKAHKKKKARKHYHYHHKHKLRVVLKNPQVWFVGLMAFFCWAPISVFAALWGVPFLKTLYHISNAHAASMISVVWVGIAVGGPALGWLSGYIKRRKTPVYIGLSCGLMTTLGIIYGGHLHPSFMLCLLFFMGLASGVQAVSFGFILDIVPTGAIGAASGFNNMAIVLGGIILTPLVGFILHWSWHGVTNHGVPVYNVSAYHYALAMVPTSYLLGLLTVVFLVKETFARAR